MSEVNLPRLRAVHWLPPLPAAAAAAAAVAADGAPSPTLPHSHTPIPCLLPLLPHPPLPYHSSSLIHHSQRYYIRFLGTQVLLTLLYPLIGRFVNHVDTKYGSKGLVLSTIYLYSAYFLPLLFYSGSMGYRSRHQTKSWIIYREPSHSTGL